MSTISNTRASIFIILFLLCGSLIIKGHQTSLSHGKNLVEAALNVSPAVVKVVAYDEVHEQLRSGSGFVLQPDGEVVSNFHVIKGASQIEITSSNGEVYPVEQVILADARRDYVLLKIDASKLPAVQLGNVSRVRAGEAVIALGHQQRDGFTVTSGTFSGHREEGSQQWLQHTASIAPGSSGGPLVNQYGEVIGINTAYTPGYQSLVVAIPINDVQYSVAKTMGLTVLVYIRDCLQYLRFVTL